MAVGDWSNTSSFWTGTPPLIYSAIKCNTMFLNAYRLLKGGERAPCCGHVSDHVIASGAGVWRYYGIRLNDPGPWDRIKVMEKWKTNGSGTGNITVARYFTPPLTGLGSLNLDCQDYQADYTWVTVLDADITAWGEGNKLIEFDITLSGASGCTELRIRCGHVMLYSSL